MLAPGTVGRPIRWVVAWLAVGFCLGASAQIASPDAPTVDMGSGVVARSARLSFLTEGLVQIVRGSDNEKVPAQQNMALAQGDRVTTAESGQAEIEFEDGSVARLTPNSGLALDYLGTDSAGDGSVTILRAMRGLVYLEMRASQVARFRVVAGGDTFWPVENATVRVSLDDPPAVLSVLDGRIRLEHVTSGSGDVGGPQVIEGYRTDVKGGESLRSDAGDATRYFLSEGIATETWDQWNEARDQAAADAVGEGTRVREDFAGIQGYGWSDLDANGSWYGAAGQAPVWQPQEALAVGFDPYGYGSWSYFPGAGYTWASGYQWGWTPFRCGRWNYWDGFGWGWQPDSLCGNYLRFGSRGINVYGGPRGYRPPLVPIKRPSGVHPILPGPHPGEHPSFERGTRDDGERRIAGVVYAPIRPLAAGYTPQGGSAVGSSLRRDYPVDGRTHVAMMGVAGSGSSTVAGHPVSAPVGWRSVSARPEAPAGGSGAKVLGIFGHGQRAAAEAPVQLDRKGNPFVTPGQRPGASGWQGRSVQQGAMQPGIGLGGNRSQPGGGNTNHAGPSYQAAPRMEQHAVPPASPPAVHSPPAAPAASSGGAKK